MSTSPDPEDGSISHTAPETMTIVLAVLSPVVLSIFVWAIYKTHCRGHKRVGRNALLSMPVVRYDESLHAVGPSWKDVAATQGGTVTSALHNILAFVGVRDWKEHDARSIQEPPAGQILGRTPTNRNKVLESDLEQGARSQSPDRSCAICTEVFVRDESVRKLLCGHIYHQACVDRWLVEFSATCPVCEGQKIGDQTCKGIFPKSEGTEYAGKGRLKRGLIYIQTNETPTSYNNDEALVT